MKITDDTTIVQLSIELAKFGVDYVKASIKPGSPRPFMVTIGRIGSAECRPFECTGTGTTFAEAIDDALARYVHRMAQRDLSSRIN